jgi:hypothetical protein
MTEDELHVQILSSDGGLENELKIRNAEDLQVAIEVLQLAARYTFDQDFAVSTGPDQDAVKEKLQKLREVVEDLETVDEERLRKLEERLYYSQKLLDEQFSPSQEVKEKIEEFGEMLRGQEHVDPPRRAVDESEGGAEAESGDFGDDSVKDATDTDEVADQALLEKTVRDRLRSKVEQRDELPGSWSDLTQEILDELHEEDMAKNWNHHRSVMDATKELRMELEDEFGSEDGAEEKYTCSDCGKSFSSAVKTRSTHHNCESDAADEEDEEVDVDESQEPNDSVKRNAEAKAEDAPEPDAVEEEIPDPEEQQAEDEDIGEESDPVSDVEDIEWKSIREAVGEYKDDHGLKYLINREYGKRYTSPMMAQSFASTNDAEDWAAVEELPEGY